MIDATYKTIARARAKCFFKGIKKYKNSLGLGKYTFKTYTFLYFFYVGPAPIWIHSDFIKLYITLPCIVQNNVPCTSGLAQSIGAGTKDLFYEPYMGIVQGPGEFAEGVVIGLL